MGKFLVILLVEYLIKQLVRGGISRGNDCNQRQLQTQNFPHLFAKVNMYLYFSTKGNKIEVNTAALYHISSVSIKVQIKLKIIAFSVNVNIIRIAEKLFEF